MQGRRSGLTKAVLSKNKETAGRLTLACFSCEVLRHRDLLYTDSRCLGPCSLGAVFWLRNNGWSVGDFLPY